MVKSTKSSRIAEANEVILHVSTFGRRFFYSARFCRVAFFEMTAGGRVRFVDDFTGFRVNPFHDGRWKNFSHGGTLKCLVEALADYIEKGKAIRPGHFGPWTELFGRDLWGYGIEEMDKVRAAIEQSPCVARREETVE
jgi:hypothetical protein